MKALALFDLIPQNTLRKLCDLVKPEIVTQEGADDPKWAEKMVKSLYKKLRKSKALEELERAISNEDRLSDCIVIPLPLDGKMVSSKKSQPHVLYSRMWRYPWVRSHNELKAVDNCRYPYAKKMAQVCVNPFHYEAVHVPTPALPPIVVHKHRNLGTNDFAAAMQSFIDRYSTDTDLVPNTSFSGDELRGGFMSEAGSPCSSTYLGSPQSVNSPGCSFPPQMSGYGAPHSHSSSGANSPHQVVPGELFIGASVYPYSSSSATLPALTYGNNAQSPVSFLSDDVDMEQEQEGVDTPQTPNSTASVEEVEYCEPDCWMSIFYHEMDKRVGDAFHSTHPYLLVDGYTAPSEAERFCLGYLNNINRHPAVADARRYIGRGVRFYYIGGEVYCECLSDSAIFVQSPNCNQRHGWHPSTVCKVPPNCNLKIFNNAEFAQLLAASVKKGFAAVYALTRMCTIRISFVKGWGADYRRQTVMNTPCWIEVHLNGPLQWIDRVLTSMGAPPNVCSSFS